MKMIGKAVMTSVLILCAGCTAVAQAEQTTDDTNVVTGVGTVESVNDGNVTISYQTETDSQTKTASVPNTAIVLKDNASLQCDDLKENDDVTVTFTNGRMSVIQVQPDSSDTESSDKNTNEKQETVPSDNVPSQN